MEVLLSIEIIDTVSTSGASRGTTGETLTRHTAHTGHATSSTVDSLHDGRELALDLLLLALNSVGISLSVGLKPLETLVGAVLDGGSIVGGEFKVLLVKSVLHLEAVVLERVLGLDLLLLHLILSSELLGILDHLLDLVLGKSTLVVGDGDLVDLTSALVDSGDVKDTIGIDIEGDLNLGSTTRGRGDVVKVELAEEVVVLGELTLTIEDLDHNTGLVVSVGGEGLGLLGGDGRVSVNEVGHDTAGGLNTHGKRGDIEEEELLSLGVTTTGEDGSLDSGTVGDGVIGVDRLVKSLTTEEVDEHLLDLGDSRGTTDKDDLVDLTLGGVGILENVLNRGHALSEEVHAELLELSTRDVGGVILTIGKGIALNRGLSGGRKDSLRLLAGRSESTILVFFLKSFMQ